VPFTTNATGKVANLNADRIDDKDAADFAASGDLLFAAVAADSTLGAKRGATAAAISGPANTYAVTFDRDVNACSYTASALGSADADAVFGVAANPANKNQVLVDQLDDPAVPTSFHVWVIC
jgi:hypothetical protein